MKSLSNDASNEIARLRPVVRRGSYKYWKGPVTQAHDLINEAWAWIRANFHKIENFSFTVSNLQDEDDDGIITVDVKYDGPLIDEEG